MFRLASLGAAFFSVSAVALAATALAPSTILANPSSYDGKAVTVTGKVDHFSTTKTLMGTVAGYQLCDSKCIVVIDQKNATHANGDTVTISGTFQTSFKGPKKTYTNVVMIK